MNSQGGARSRSPQLYLHVKPTDTHLYLLANSCHPRHYKEAIPFSQALRMRCICSSDDDYQRRAAELETHLLRRGYEPSFVQQQIHRASLLLRFFGLDIVCNKVIMRACIMDSEMPYFLVWPLCIKCLVHLAVYCIILVLSLVLFMQSLYTLSNFSFICLLSFFLLFLAVTVTECSM